MTPSIDWFNVLRLLALLGALQGIILFSLLFQRRKNKSNLYLSFFLLSLSAYLIPYADPTFLIYLKHPYLIVIIDFIPFLHAPLMYFYFFHTLHKNASPRFPFIIHSIPALLDIVIVHSFYFLVSREKITGIIQQTLLDTPHIAIQIDNWLKYIPGIIYGFLIIKMILAYARSSPVWLKNKRHQKWLIALTSAFVYCWVVVIATGIIIYNYKMNQGIVRGFLFFQTASITGSMYLIAYFAFRYPTLFPSEQAREKIAQKLNLSVEKLKDLEMQLEDLMARKHHYLDDNASLQSTAKKLHTHPNVLSYLINENFEKNFNEYINDLRLNHFMKLVNSEKETTILRLALESGFPSKTTFNRTFKKKFNMAPGEYLENRTK